MTIRDAEGLGETLIEWEDDGGLKDCEDPVPPILLKPGFYLFDVTTHKLVRTRLERRFEAQQFLAASEGAAGCFAILEVTRECEWTECSCPHTSSA